MNFDINEVLKEMTAAVKGVVGENWSEVESVTSQFLQRRKSRLEKLALDKISGKITEKKFKSRLEDEAHLAEAELNALAVITKAITQKAANAAIEVLESAIKNALTVI